MPSRTEQHDPIRVEVIAVIDITFNDDAVWRQCVENWDDQNVPQPYDVHKRGTGWRDMFYPDVNTKEKVAEHLAFNYAINHATLDRLDGFANFPSTAVTYKEVEFETDIDP